MQLSFAFHCIAPNLANNDCAFRILCDMYLVLANSAIRNFPKYTNRPPITSREEGECCDDTPLSDIQLKSLVDLALRIL